MYPFVYSLLQLDKFLKIEDLQNKEKSWRNEMHSIVKSKPKDDILPVRMEYSKIARNIGINYLTSAMWTEKPA